jgi:hypothetical protein
MKDFIFSASSMEFSTTLQARNHFVVELGDDQPGHGSAHFVNYLPDRSLIPCVADA